MSEIRTTTDSSDLTRRFIELILMQAQQAALCLGQIPHPSTGKSEVNLEAARLFIDQLEVIREKTRGNLNADEEKILTNVLSELQLAFVHVAKGGEPTSFAEESFSEPEPSILGSASDTPAASEPVAAPAENEEEQKKKFTKSYGA